MDGDAALFEEALGGTGGLGVLDAEDLDVEHLGLILADVFIRSEIRKSSGDEYLAANGYSGILGSSVDRYRSKISGCD